MLDKNALRKIAGLPMIAESIVAEAKSNVNPDLLGKRYPEGSSDFEDAVSTVHEHLKDARSILTAGAWTDWVEETDSNFSASNAAKMSKSVVKQLSATIAAFDALYEHIVKVSED